MIDDLQTVSEEPPVLRGGQQYWNLMSVEAHREDGTYCKVTGAVFGNQPHIVQVRYLGTSQRLLRAVCPSRELFCPQSVVW